VHHRLALFTAEGLLEFRHAGDRAVGTETRQRVRIRDDMVARGFRPFVRETERGGLCGIVIALLGGREIQMEIGNYTGQVLFGFQGVDGAKARPQPFYAMRIAPGRFHATLPESPIWRSLPLACWSAAAFSMDCARSSGYICTTAGCHWCWACPPEWDARQSISSRCTGRSQYTGLSNGRQTRDRTSPTLEDRGRFELEHNARTRPASSGQRSLYARATTSMPR
jgi:hypothetical protein